MEGDKKSLFGIFRDKQFLVGLLIGFVIVLVIFVIILLALKFKGSNQELSGFDQTTAVGGVLETESITNPEINTFELKKDAQICKEGGKPVIYLFTTSWCPHCQWIKNTFQEVMLEYMKDNKIKAYSYDVETGDNLFTSGVETQLPVLAEQVLNEFNPEGSIPTFVFGCQYFRIGNGYEQENNLVKEAAEFKAIINELLK